MSDNQNSTHNRGIPNREQLEKSIARNLRKHWVQKGYEKGWSFTPMNGKKPFLTSWQNLDRASLEDSLAWSENNNIGLRTGEASGIVVVDIDLYKGGDVPEDLPKTVTVKTGRGGEHRYYRLPPGIVVNCSSKGFPSHIDIRGNGGVVVYPGSVHPDTGEVYKFSEGLNPDQVEMAVWSEDFRRHYASSLAAQKERPRTEKFKAFELYTKTYGDSVEGENGSGVLFGYICQLFRANFCNSECELLLQEYLQKKCQPLWSRGEVEHKLEDAAKAVASDSKFVRLKILPSDQPMCLAKHVLEELYSNEEGFTLRKHQGDWYTYRNGVYKTISSEALKASITQELHGTQIIRADGKRSGLAVRKALVEEVVFALPALGILVEGTTPQWIDADIGGKPDRWINCKNGILCLNTYELLPHTIGLFTTRQLPVDYYAHSSGQMKYWPQFLNEILQEDEEAIALLQEWFGACIVGDTRYHKILCLHGERRSGKGTILKILTALLGEEAVFSPTFRQMQTAFGRSGLIGKSLLCIADMRVGKRADSLPVVEDLLTMSGGDVQTIPRKYKEDWVGYLNANIMLISNALPELPDASGAIASRMLPLHLPVSHLGSENLSLVQNLLMELPMILRWSLEGHERLNHIGRFTVPQQSSDTILELESLCSPMRAFVAQKCDVGSQYSVQVSALFQVWRVWCEMQGHTPGSVQAFGTNLRSVVPALSTKNGRVDGKQVRTFYGIRPKLLEDTDMCTPLLRGETSCHSQLN